MAVTKIQCRYFAFIALFILPSREYFFDVSGVELYIFYNFTAAEWSANGELNFAMDRNVMFLWQMFQY